MIPEKTIEGKGNGERMIRVRRSFIFLLLFETENGKTILMSNKILQIFIKTVETKSCVILYGGTTSSTFFALRWCYWLVKPGQVHRL